MRSEVTINAQPIDEGALVAGRQMSHGMGAAVYFAGVVRASEGADTISALDYEAFENMARHQFEVIFNEIEKRWPIESIRLVHRTGLVKVNEASLWVEVIAP